MSSFSFFLDEMSKNTSIENSIIFLLCSWTREVNLLFILLSSHTRIQRTQNIKMDIVHINIKEEEDSILERSQKSDDEMINSKENSEEGEWEAGKVDWDNLITKYWKESTTK